MGGEAITLAGFTGSGKTHFCKSYALLRENVLVFDVNNEYNLPEWDISKKWEGGRFRYTGMNFNAFLSCISGIDSNGALIKKILNTNIICEDASGFMKGQIGKNAMQIFQGKRHSNNNYFFLYHAVELVPRDIYRFTNKFVLFAVNETPKQIGKRFLALEQAAIKLNLSKEKYKKIIVKLQ